MNMSIYYDGLIIQVIPEHGHYCLKNGNREQRCDTGELKEAVLDFAEVLLNEQKKLSTV
ncbi:hypothetical protein [Kineothrix sedimenti]|uniref:Uncharacterized protein n=1 Tax=Kineothrix sedimenti TaxID=3123317 RepID=A0ABZ3F2R8_9FIRM